MPIKGENSFTNKWCECSCSNEQLDLDTTPGTEKIEKQ